MSDNGDDLDGDDLEKQAKLELAKERERENQRRSWREHLDARAEKGRARRERDIEYLEQQKKKQAPPEVSDIYERFVRLAGELVDYNSQRPRGRMPELRLLPSGGVVATCDKCGRTSPPLEEEADAVAVWETHRRERCG
jgi:hypothetical protein